MRGQTPSIQIFTIAEVPMRTFLVLALLISFISGCKSTRNRQEPPRQDSPPPTVIIPAQR